MKNPLKKRIPRELKGELGKYMVIFLFFTIIIGVVSGFLVADDSLMKAYDESFEKYNIEDGNFELMTEADSDLLGKLEDEGGIRLYENYYKDEETLSFDSTLRIFADRKEVNKVSLLEGDMPSSDDEIAIDRLYAKNHSLKKGSIIKIGGKDLKVSGIAALTDYSTLYENPSDLMFDNDSFGVGVMTDEGFASVRDDHIHYSYSWKYDKKPADDKEAQTMSEDLVKIISSNAVLVNYIPAYINQAIIFAGDDMGGDKSSIIAFLYITVIILAFIFSVTTDSTITKESGVIGTLRATGYTRGELVRHYLVIPVLMLLCGAVVGNILGYTFLEKFMAKAYLGSYSLTAYEVRFNAEAFIITTIIPFIIMLVINFITLSVKLRISPLRFIKHDLSRKGHKKAFRLNTKIPILVRYRLRIIFQNIPNYVIMVVGILLANVILFFGMAFKPMLLSFQDTVVDNMLSSYIYILKAPAETENETAEKARLTTLSTKGDEAKGAKSEEVSIYGISDDSRYVRKDSGICISTAYHDKYGVDIGDTITLKEKYTDKEYDMKVDGYYDYPSTIAIFMDMEKFDEYFDAENTSEIYFADTEITDIDEKLIAARINEDDLTKTSRQLIRSMSSIMDVFLLFGVVMFVMIVFLLAKIIVERNAQSISMAKILGYSNREINGLYVHTTTIVTLLAIVCTIPLVDRILAVVFKIVFMSYSGYMQYYVSPVVMLKAAMLGIVSYLVIAFILNSKVKKIPLADALKNVD